jgi:integrase
VGVVDIDKRWIAINGHRLKIIARSHVVDGIDDVAKTKGKVAADRCKTALSTFFVWCADHGFCDLNPTMHIKNRAGNRSRERVLSVQELAEVWRACGSADFGHIVKLLLLSGFRRREIGDLSWTEVHLCERLIKLPGERVKNKPHAIWLSDQSLAILTSIPASETRNLVFGRGADGYGGRGAAKAAT